MSPLLESSHGLDYSIVSASWQGPGVLPSSRQGPLTHWQRACWIWSVFVFVFAVEHVEGRASASGVPKHLVIAWRLCVRLLCPVCAPGRSGASGPLAESGPRLLQQVGHWRQWLCIWGWPLELVSLSFLCLDEWFGSCFVWQRLWVLTQVHFLPGVLSRLHFPASPAVRNGGVTEYWMWIEMRGAHVQVWLWNLLCGETPSRRDPEEDSLSLGNDGITRWEEPGSLYHCMVVWLLNVSTEFCVPLIYWGFGIVGYSIYCYLCVTNKIWFPSSWKEAEHIG